MIIGVVGMFVGVNWGDVWNEADVGAIEIPAIGGGAVSVGGADDLAIPAGVTLQVTSATMNLAFVDKYERGSNFVPTTTKYRECGTGSWADITTGTTAATPGKCYDFYASNETFNNFYVTNKIAPYANEWQLDASKGFVMTKNGSSTIQVWNDAGALLGDNSTGNNQTMSSGEDANLRFELMGLSEGSTSKNFCVVEATDNTKITDTTITGPGVVDKGSQKPSAFVMAGVNSRIDSFVIPELFDGATFIGKLKLNSISGQDASTGNIEVVCYDMQYYIDGDTGVVYQNVEDVAGTQKYKNQGFDTRFYMA